MTDAAQAAADGGAMTASEQAYFESGGQQTEGLAGEGEQQATEKQVATEQVEQQGDSQTGDTDQETPQLNADGKPANKGQWVRYGALHAEREQHKATKAEMEKLREERARFDERLKVLNEAFMASEQPQKTAEPEKPDPEPDLETDFIGHQKWLSRQSVKLEQAIEAQKRENAELKEIIHGAAAENDLITEANEDAMAFAEKTPDFFDAYGFLLEQRGAMLREMGYSPKEVNKQLRQEELGIVVRAKQINKSPAEVMYGIARNFGYRAPAQQQQQPQNGQPQSQPAQGDAAAKVDQINAGQAAAKSLSGAGGRAPVGLTAEALINMSQEEFNAVLRKNRSTVERIMGKGA